MAIHNLSQGHLEVWETCRRKYKYLFLDELVYPLNPEIQASIELGKKFHLLVQQERLGLEISNFSLNSPELIQWLDNYHQHPPALISGVEYLEYPVSHILDNYLLTAVYDLLILGENHAQIIDWKTHRHPKNYAYLRQHWQTKLYFYILHNKIAYACEHLSMTYWFANAQNDRQSVVIKYSSEQHQQTHQELCQTIQAIATERSFPTLSADSKACQSCEFRHLCHDRPENKYLSQLDIDQIPEIPIF